jgi:hypothetical protein
MCRLALRIAHDNANASSDGLFNRDGHNGYRHEDRKRATAAGYNELREAARRAATSGAVSAVAFAPNLG